MDDYIVVHVFSTCNLSIQLFVRGAVLFMLADTLAAHSIGGFKIGVGFALRKCRMCLATQEQAATMVYIACLCVDMFPHCYS